MSQGGGNLKSPIVMGQLFGAITTVADAQKRSVGSACGEATAELKQRELEQITSQECV
jgi:hypothetical protein